MASTIANGDAPSGPAAGAEPTWASSARLSSPPAAPPPPPAEALAFDLPAPPADQDAHPFGVPAPQAPTEPAEPAITGPTELRARPASWWRSVIAQVIDLSLLAAVLYGYLTLAGWIAGLGEPRTAAGILDRMAYQLLHWTPVLLPGLVLAALLGLVYAAVGALVWRGRTVGRLLTGIRLVDRTGRPPGPVRSVIRAFLSLVSFALLGGGFFWAFFDRKGQTLHDKLTRTWPVRPLGER